MLQGSGNTRTARPDTLGTGSWTGIGGEIATETGTVTQTDACPGPAAAAPIGTETARGAGVAAWPTCFVLRHRGRAASTD